MRLVIQITKVYWFLLKPSPHQDLRKVKVKVAQSCPTLCDPMNCTVYEILQARILEWVAFPSSRVSSQVSCIAGKFFTS